MKMACIFVCLAVVMSAASAFMVAPAARAIPSSSARSASACGVMPTSGQLRSGGLRDMHMGGKKSKFGIFSPAVIAAKVVLGESRLNKIRGKGITLHSQAITQYCTFIGASQKARGLLIRKAKVNGDTLGFLW